jgi:hypothetical protein
VSFTDTRAELATALSTVTGLTGYEFKPTVITAGDAWALLDTADRGPGLAWSATWKVLVCLGGDEVKAMQMTDDVLPELVLALNPIAYVDQARPVIIATEGGPILFGLELTCTSE